MRSCFTKKFMDVDWLKCAFLFASTRHPFIRNTLSHVCDNWKLHVSPFFSIYIFNWTPRQVFVTVPLSGLYVVIPSLEIERIRLYKPFHLWTLMQKKDTPHNGFYWINVQFTGRTPSKLLWKSETGISLRFWEIELIQNRGYFVFLHLCIVEGECYLDRFSSPP